METTITAERPRVRVPAGSSALSTRGFMHLVGLAPTAEGAPPEGEAAPERHKDGKFKPAEKDADDDGDAKKGKKKDGDAGEDGDGEDDDDKEGDDDTDEDESSGKKGKKRANARARERSRCAAIFNCEHAASNVALAAQLAFGTSLTRSQAIAVLAKAPAGVGMLAAAMTRIPNAPVGPGAAAEKPTAVAIEASWDKAFGKTKR